VPSRLLCELRVTKKMLAHLNVHSIFSKMRGTAGLQELLARAKAHGQKYLALTEVNGLWASFALYNMPKKPILSP
ncbi:MAG: PHP domain-containing protein, partial [Candidatus Marinimicrobia bacterium]|nr:PHP domain-containing protein [Candidatus Neomarinimicrobiota bacterium]